MNTQIDKQIKSKKQKWIGLVHVKPKPNNDSLEGAKGAFVSAIALANDEMDFSGIVTDALNGYDFEVVAIEDIELFEKRIKKFPINQETIELAEKINEENFVEIGTFHSYIE